MKDLNLNPHNYPTTPEIDTNLQILQSRLKKLRLVCPFEFIVTSGLRSQAKQDELIATGKSKANKSKHLKGLAADISDPDGKIKTWILENVNKLEDSQLWCEDFNYTEGWVHLQCVSPLSGRRFFIP